MITYEKAKELKDAGFPQSTNMKHYHATHGLAVGIPHPDTLIDPEVVAMPNLLELIEACGDDFVALVRWESDLWTAANCERDTPMVRQGLEIKTEGSTPEEAVANLWLKLNEK